MILISLLIATSCKLSLADDHDHDHDHGDEESRHVEGMGACYNPTSHGSYCALAPEWCGTVDYDPNQPEDVSGYSLWIDPDTAAGYNLECGCSDIAYGCCYDPTSHDCGCTAFKDQCPDGRVWVAPGGTSDCTCEDKKDAELGERVDQSKYGACYSTTTHQSACALHAADCPDGSMFLDSFTLAGYTDTACHCQDVKTGGCYDTTTHAATCAISADSCGTKMWMTVAQLEGYDIDCRLCDAPAPTPAPTKAPTKAESDDIPEAIIIIAAVAAGVILIGTAALCMFRKAT